MFYAVKTSDPFTLRVYRSKEEAQNEDKDLHIFSNSDELAELPLSLDDLRAAYYLATGFETRVSERIYLCDLIFDAILKLGLEPTVPELEPVTEEPAPPEPVVEETPEPVVEETPEPVVEETPEPVVEATVKEPRAPSRNPWPFAKPAPEPVVEPEPEEKPKKKIYRSTIRLTEKPKIKYSQREQTMFGLIVSKYPEHINTKELGELALDSKYVFHVKTTVVSVLKSLHRKMAFNGEPWVLNFSGHNGPKPMRVSVEERETK